MTNRVESLLTAALAAAERGWAVFPLRPGTKKPAFHGDTRERPCPRTGICRDGHLGWEQRATSVADEVRWIWTSRRYAGCNIGIPMGRSDMVGVDLDLPKSADDVAPEGFSRKGAKDGLDVFALVCADAGHPVPTDTFTVRTARRGRHLYFRQPPGVQLRNTEGDLGWKVDTRGHGGYVVAPGSITRDGRYEVIRDLPVADLPGWLVQALSPKPSTAKPAANRSAVDRLPRYVAAAIAGECERVATAPPGHGRALFISGATLGELVGARLLSPAEAEDALYDAALSLINSGCGCTEREVLRAIRNGLRLGQTRPRQIPA